mgnify:CR=1 FL=1
MNNYEIVYIIHPALQEGRLNDIKSKIHEKITSFKGKVLYDDNWGKKKLAYAIDKQKYGTYLFCQFLLEGKDVQAINTDCELNSNILRHLISRIDSSQILDEKDKKEVKKEVSDKKIEVKKEASKEVVEEKVSEEVKEEEVSEKAQEEEVSGEATEEISKKEAEEKEEVSEEIKEDSTDSDSEETKKDDSEEK